MSKVLVTGANGFIGSHIVDRMILEGHQVYGLVRQSSDLSLLAGTNITLLYGDVTDPASLEAAVKGIDIVIHNAGLASDWGPLEIFMKINFDGTKHLALAASKAGVKRFVLLSSVAIHGFGSDDIMDENSPVKTHGFHYSISKWEAEKWLFEFSKSISMEVTAIRPGNVYGPRDHTFIEKYLDVLSKGPAGYVNGGRSRTCPLYVGNLTQAIALASVDAKAAGQSFIVTDGLDIDWKSFTEKLTDAAGFKRPTLSIPFFVGNAVSKLFETIFIMFHLKNAPVLTSYRMHNGGKNYYFSINKAKTLLGFVPETDLDAAIQKTVDWYLTKHPQK